MNDLSKIPPVQLPITTVATNIMQTPQTPLDQKITLTKEEKKLIEEKKARKKDQVTINEKHLTMLKERGEIEELRELQIILLFSQLMQQGLIYLQENLKQIESKLAVEELEKPEIRQSLPIFYQDLLDQLSQQIAPIEKQLKFLVGKGSNLIEARQGYWQIKNHKKTFPVQRMLRTFKSEYQTVTFPDTLKAEEIIAIKTEELVEMREHLATEKKKADGEYNKLERYEKQFEEANKRKEEKKVTLDYWERLAESKEIEHAYVQKKVQQMELTHPLKRKQHEYQAYVLRDQIIQQELAKALTEVKKARGLYRAVDNQAIHAEKELLEVRQQSKVVQEHLRALDKEYQRAIQTKQALSQSFEIEFREAYATLMTIFEQYLIDIQEEQSKAISLERYYREQLAETLKDLKKTLEQAQKPLEKEVLAYLKQELAVDQTATFLSQANAEALNVHHLLDDQR